MFYSFEKLNPPEGVIHEFLLHSGLNELGLIPYSVAEMRFELPPEIRDSIQCVLDKGSFGYEMSGAGYYKAVTDWMKRRHNWDIEAEWITQTYGVVSALGVAIRAFSDEGDGVIIQPPVYPPFFSSVTKNNRRIVENPLKYTGGVWEMDFDDLELKAKDAKLLILCSPHNPVGRVWTKAELEKLAHICARNGVIIMSDEIHNDLIFSGYKHTVLACVSDEAKNLSVICTAPSKTFNIAGLLTSNIIIPNDDLRKKFKAAVSRDMGEFLNAIGSAACETAYTKCEGWIDYLMGYLEKNYELIKEFIAENLPQIGVPALEGTYLLWLDMRFLGMDSKTLNHFLIHNAKLVTSSGDSFGGDGFVRLNIACPRRYIQDALDRLKSAIDAL